MLFADDYVHGAIKQFMNCLLLPYISFTKPFPVWNEAEARVIFE